MNDEWGAGNREQVRKLVYLINLNTAIYNNDKPKSKTLN
ncbi:hypothetical protein MTo_02525 [Microcystis aeruginosa NIES-1211]|jgi:hypothetical protein|uniref:Uncharacterized protein n=2 Tax=Microcystis aeruginosa TaxID=1126 RepID=A0A5A5R531_MICAE|nr:hypothetical protein MTo_02525 [Microcystis aeruginosa NIES-1211]GCA71514.1 hypothetical protein MiYa_03055 [Microcystis aeruginosa NIES-2519]GCE59948.1 hypothetical protein MiAbB_01867 [Microcystis aeruginosa NIES-4285]